MPGIVFKISAADSHTLDKIRCLPGLFISVDENLIWLKTESELPDIDIRLKQLPVKNIFLVDENNRLFPPGNLTPVGTLKQMEWLPISEFIKVTLPPSLLPGNIKELLGIKLIRSASMHEGCALLTKLHIFKKYAEMAPAVRLSFLKFALSENNEVLVVGKPLPALPGKEYWLIDNILLPCGFDFEIPMVAKFINERLNPHNNSVIVFDEEGQYEKIENTFFVEAKRSAVRLTKEAHASVTND